MNPRKVYIYLDAYNMKMKRQSEYDNQLAHLQGAYYREALMSTVGNLFAKKGSKPHEYPKKPFGTESSYDEEKQVEMTEEEKIRKTKLFFARLNAMKTNFELNKKEQE